MRDAHTDRSTRAVLGTYPSLSWLGGVSWVSLLTLCVSASVRNIGSDVCGSYVALAG